MARGLEGIDGRGLRGRKTFFPENRIDYVFVSGVTVLSSSALPQTYGRDRRPSDRVKELERRLERYAEDPGRPLTLAQLKQRIERRT